MIYNVNNTIFNSLDTTKQRLNRQISYEITNIVYSDISLIKTHLHRNYNNIWIALELIRVPPNDSIITFEILSCREMLEFSTTVRNNIVLNQSHELTSRKSSKPAVRYLLWHTRTPVKLKRSHGPRS